MKHALIVAASLAAAAMVSPASAKGMKCDGASMGKSYSTMAAMADSPQKMAMQKEIGMANMEMSKGNMRGACMHMMKADRMGMMSNKMSSGMMSNKM